ncbi:hypothetical protein SELMODRAFT_421701 [Selaginella moellendorffii]|uniref:Uncharacterized protein n=1 Tax=Selaginella moellendorffii TaxID=88036 RepID=D8SG38_SELML|nr:hypothetical protein SELMODRAFT_421701 [Selaginella moellendorffii]
MKAVLVFLVLVISTFQIALSSSPSSSSSRELLDEAEIYGVSVAVEPASNSSLVNLSADMDDWEGGKHRGDSNNNNNINININIFCKKNKSMYGDQDGKKSMDHDHKEEEEQKSMDGDHKDEEEDKKSMDQEHKEEDKKRYFP